MWYKLTINLVVPVSLIHIFFLFRVEMEVKQDQNTIYIVELIFSQNRREKRGSQKSNMNVLCVAAFDDVKLHNMMTDVRQQERQCRKEALWV